MSIVSLVHAHPVQVVCLLALLALVYFTLCGWIEAKRFKRAWRRTGEEFGLLLGLSSTAFLERFHRCINGAVSDDPVCDELVHKLHNVAREADSRAELVERLDDHLEGMWQPLIKAVGALAGQIPNAAICLSGFGFAGVLLGPLWHQKAEQPFIAAFMEYLPTFFGEFATAVLINSCCMFLASWATSTRASLYLSQFKTSLLVREVADRLIAIERYRHANKG